MAASFKIKVCGMRDSANIEQLALLPIDYMGFIFYPPSPRYVGNILDINVLMNIPKHIKKVGVFVNTNINELLITADKYSLDYIQLHGNETPDYCNCLRYKGIKVIKAFKAEAELLTCETSRYHDVCDYFLFDTPTIKHGGSGIKFNWEILKKAKIALPFFLSGGIAPGDEPNLKNLEIPNLFAIDINSKFEVEPGLKNIGRIQEFVRKIKQ